MTDPVVTPVIRRATEDDVATLSAFARQQFIETFAAQNDPDDLAAFLDATYSPDQQRAELHDPTRSYWLLEMDGQLAGFALLRDQAPHDAVVARHPVEVQRFYVDRAWHGRGLAATLMAHACETARALGGDTVWLGVFEQNPRAIRFYEKQGFAAVGAQTFMVGTDAQRDVVMARRLVRAD